MNASLAIVILLTILIGQQVLASVAYYDATRRGIKFPNHYAIGIFAPLMGLIVIPAYVYKRHTLPQENGDSSNSTAEDRRERKLKLYMILCLASYFILLSVLKY